MPADPTRRRWLKTGALTPFLASGWFAGLGNLPRLTAAEVNLPPTAVRFQPEIEPLVRFLEITPRDRLLEETAHRIRNGTTYRQLLAALLLAGIRNIQPRPVGFKFHAVLVVHSAHLASQHSPDADRWLPLFWALDYFKSSQARDVAEGDWTMEAVDESAVPKLEKAGAEFADAMDRWDPARVDVAAAAIARSQGAHAAFDLFARYGARDYRDIGHKAIYVANSWRTLQTIGWQNAEPVLRSLGFALLKHSGDNPADRDALSDRPGRKNLIRLKEIPASWLGGHHQPDLVREMLETLRHGDWDATAAMAVSLLKRGSGPQALWDAMFQASAELLMRAPGIISLHSCTTTNALHHAFQHAADDDTRRFLLLQNASFLAFFRDDSGTPRDLRIDTLEADPAIRPEPESLEGIFATLSAHPTTAASRTLAYLDQGGDPAAFMDLARRMIYLKGRDSHDYKFSSAVLEDFHHISPAFRNRFLAASVHWLKGADLPDSPLVARTRNALGA